MIADHIAAAFQDNACQRRCLFRQLCALDPSVDLALIDMRRNDGVEMIDFDLLLLAAGAVLSLLALILMLPDFGLVSEGGESID